MPADARASAITLPGSLATRRLILRPPQVEDAAAINAGIRESFRELNTWMEWAVEVPSVDETRAFCESSVRDRRAGTACPMLILDGSDDTFIGASGYARIDWAVPSFEIGY